MAPEGKTIDRLKTVFGLADAAWTGGASLSVDGEIACRAGCFGCCVGLFEVSLPEAALALAGFSALSGEEGAAVLERSRRIVATSGRLFPGDPSGGILDPDRTEPADDRFFEAVADVACPMLELPAGRCRIYAFRPVTCRTYGLAWKKGSEPVHPSCGLNFVAGGAARQAETGIDLDHLGDGLAEIARTAEAVGISPAAETTLAHAVTGAAFRKLRGED